MTIHRVIIASLFLFVAGAGTVPAQPVQADPYLWLEDIAGARPLAWVKEQNARTVAALEAAPRFFDILNNASSVERDSGASTSRLPVVVAHGEWLYNLWQDKSYERGLWRRTTMAQFRKTSPRWEAILNLDRLAADEHENWVWKGASCAAPGYERCLVRLSRSGADAVVIREFDVASRSFVTDGFNLAEAKGSMSWVDRDTVFVQTDFGPGTTTQAGYPRLVKLWRRGTPLENAAIVFEGQASDVSVGAFQVRRTGYPVRQIVQRNIGRYAREFFLRQMQEDAPTLRKLDLPPDATVWFAWNKLFLHLRSPWRPGPQGGTTYAQDALVYIDFDRFLEGARNFDVVFEPAARKTLGSIGFTRDYLVVNELDDLRNTLVEYSLTDGRLAKQASYRLGGTLDVTTFGDGDSNDYFVTAADYLVPPALWVRTAGGTETENAIHRLKTTPAFFDSLQYQAEHRVAVSRDGEKIPYTIIMRGDAQRDGSHPTLLYGYGGFENLQAPRYLAAIGNAWLAHGGIYVVAHIRGGGEFGPKWHQAAVGANRQRSFDDFIAVAEDLIAQKITSPAHLGIAGGSNGGLLVGAAMVQRPDLFGAVVCSVPLLDMRRFHLLLAGASWLDEYGNPDDPADWEYLAKYSPYQNVRAGVKYPRVLFLSSTRDDRVHPGHARKMVAKMQDQGHAVLYFENTEGGHAAAADAKQRNYRTALQYSFLMEALK